MTKIKLKCECDKTTNVPPENQYRYLPEEKSGMKHNPNECKGTNEIKKYKRDSNILSLCSCCNLIGDIEI